MRSIIFANGEYCQEVNEINLAADDLVIAADGGSGHCQNLGIIPNLLIGDLDSTSQDLIQEWENAGVLIIRHPAQKDQTDLELALSMPRQKELRRSSFTARWAVGWI